MKKTPIKTSAEFLRAIANLFDEIEPETPEEIDEVLREAGYDPDEIGKRMKAVAEKTLAETKCSTT